MPMVASTVFSWVKNYFGDWILAVNGVKRQMNFGAVSAKQGEVYALVDGGGPKGKAGAAGEF